MLKEKLPLVLINTLLLHIPLLALTDGLTEIQMEERIHSLCVGWRNLFSSCAEIRIRMVDWLHTNSYVVTHMYQLVASTTAPYLDFFINITCQRFLPSYLEAEARKWDEIRIRMIDWLHTNSYVINLINQFVASMTAPYLEADVRRHERMLFYFF